MSPAPFTFFVTVTQSCLQVVILLLQLPKELGLCKGKTEGVKLVTHSEGLGLPYSLLCLCVLAICVFLHH